MEYTNNFTIKKWAEEDRPREKLQLKGRSALSDAELIAILLGSGNRSMSAVDLAKQLLKAIDNSLSKLGKLSIDDLSKYKGIGPAKATTIIAALELGRRRKESQSEKSVCIRSSADAYVQLQSELMDLDHEEFWVLFLNRANIVIRKQRFSSGGISGTVVDSRIIIKGALEQLASSIILVHNHPSGNLKPSQSDKLLTKKIKDAASLFDINILDHLIFTNDGYFSFSDELLL